MALLAASAAIGIGLVVAKVITAFGVGLVTYTALNNGIDTLETLLLAQTGNFAGDALQIINLAGVLEGMSIVLAALVTRASIIFVTRLAAGLSPA